MEIAIIGVGEADGGRPADRSAFELSAEAAFRAIHDAGIEPRQVDAVLFEAPMSEHHHMPASLFLEYLGIEAKYHAAFEVGGTTPFAMAIHGIALIEAGLCETVLIVDSDSRASHIRGDKVAGMSEAVSDIPAIDQPYFPTTVSRYAQVAQRHMYEFGTTAEQLATVAVVTREHACRNPGARFREPLTVEQVLASRMIASPIHLLECCLISDWATAFVLSSRRKASGTARKPVFLVGCGESAVGYNIAAAPDIKHLPGPRAAQRAYQMAGMRPEQMSLALVYDSFTITHLLALEDLGLCAQGEGGPFIAAGHTRPGGRIPVNPHGGQLSYQCGHGQYIVEAVRQLRGEAGDRQVPDARYAVAHAQAALYSAAFSLILAR